MNQSYTESFVKTKKQNRAFDDGICKNRKNKKQDFHRQSRANGNKKKDLE